MPQFANKCRNRETSCWVAVKLASSALQADTTQLAAFRVITMVGDRDGEHPSEPASFASQPQNKQG
ncbi:hypothetical protein H6F46_18335 [Limnothrix sp. FACHB-1083]|uniref:hypothetical protein n=1 Tax=unclassified Limnothrix TaxID=2632864 RepID=UPI0016804C83|nr:MULTISPECIES: hypothetical protein [unclassified Limnothrix]MBD2162650.1 hypothetical protein [Limnothrix sp. FACHB-1083]MBD2193687.1 hypothetical protein [Limnothrix sp. FACHB-1088]